MSTTAGAYVGVSGKNGTKEVTVKHHQHNGESSSSEHAFADFGQIVLLIVFFVVWIADSFIFRFSMALATIITVNVRLPIGGMLIAASCLLALPAHNAVFGTPHERAPVITSGVYRIVRHPMYFGSWLFFLGIAVTTLSIASLAVAVLAFLFYFHLSRHEEIYLERKYPAVYAQYKAEVPMLFPIPRRRKSGAA